MYPIDKGIPAPSHQKAKYPLDAMQVGDSFFAPGVKIDSVSSSAHRHGKKHGQRFIARTVDGGVRVWRIA